MVSVMHHGIKLRHLRLFQTMAETGSLTAAARALGLSQPALSKSLAELETLLGVALVQRQGRRLVLTAPGEAFRRQSREALMRLDAAAAALHDAARPDRLSVGLLPTVSTRFFPQVVGQFLQEADQPTLSIETGAHPVLLRKLREGHIDLMIGRMPAPSEMAGLEFEFLYEEPIIAAVRAGHAGLGQPMAQVLRRVPLILPTRDSIIRATVDAYLGALNLGALRPAVETSTLALGRGILLASPAVWFISQGVVEAELESGQFASLPLGATYLSGAVGLTRRAETRPAPALSRLIDLARKAAVARREIPLPARDA